MSEQARNEAGNEGRSVTVALPDWQPIETAPKMKTILLFAVTDIGEDGSVRNWKMATGSYHIGYEGDEKRSPWCWDGRQLAHYEILPTHWMPLPLPPAKINH